MKLFLFAVVLAAFSLPAEVIWRAPEPVEPAEYLGFDNGPVVRFNLQALTVEEGGLEGFGSGVIFRVPGGGCGTEPGTPDLPVIRRMVQIPATGGFDLEVVSSETSVLGCYNVLPFQPFPDRSGGSRPPLQVDDRVYGVSSPFPASPVTIDRISILRDIRVAWISFCPVQVNPVTGLTTLTTGVTVRLVPNGAPGENELVRVSTGTTRSFLPVYREVLGFQGSDAVVDGSYLVIGSEAAIGLCADLIQWKREKGYEVVVTPIETIGSTSAAVDAYIENAFNTWENPPEWLLLLGDETIVPVYWAPSNIASDNQYGVIGSGYDPSIHVARLCADASKLGYVAWKVWAHETDPYEPAASWFQHGVCLGSEDFTDPLQSFRHKQIMANYGGMDVSLYCPVSTYGGVYPTISLLTGEFNSGVSLMTYIGHGSRTSWVTTGFSNSNVTALSNGRRLPWIFSIACNNAEFASGGSGDCFGEAWMKSGTTAAPKGALGFMGATVSSPYGPTDSLAIHFLRGYFQHGMYHVGEAFDYGKIKAYEYTGDGNNSNMHMIMGEPEHDLFTTTGPLVHLSASHAGTVSEGDFTVTVTAGGSPVANAMVGLCQVSTVVASDYTDTYGTVILNVSSLPGAEDVTLTVTAHNLYPLQEAVPASVGTAGETGSAVPGFRLGRATPNPVTSTATIGFGASVQGPVTLQVFDVTGRVVRTLHRGDVSAGDHSVVWDGADQNGNPVPDGLYLYRLSSPEGTLTRSCVVVR